MLAPDALANAGVDTRVASFDEAEAWAALPADVALVVVEFSPRAVAFIRGCVGLRRSETRWTPLIACCANSADIEVALGLGADDFMLNHDLVTVKSRLSVVIRQKLRNDKLDGILNCTFDGIVSIDENGLVLTFNKAAQDMFGYEASEVVGRNVSMLMPSEHAGRHDGYLRHYLATGEEHIIGRGRELLGRTKAGEPFPVFLQVASLRSGREWLFVGILKNLSVDAQAKALQHELMHDPMTGIANRLQIETTLPLWIARRADGAPEPFALLFIDLDGFKAINDTFGHDAGDAVLKAVSKRLRFSVAERDVAARMSGDEFVVLLDGVGQRAEAQAIARRLVANVSKPIGYGDISIGVRASVGIALYPDDGSTPAALLHEADTSMYGDKRSKAGAPRR